MLLTRIIITKDDLFRYYDTIPEYKTDIQNNTDKPEINVITCLEPDDSWRIDTHGNLSQKWSWDQAPSNIINYFDLNKQQFNK